MDKGKVFVMQYEVLRSIINGCNLQKVYMIFLEYEYIEFCRGVCDVMSCEIIEKEQFERKLDFQFFYKV